jgi:hypothetical protein
MVVARRFERGESMPDDVELASQLNCSSLILKSVIDDLERAQIVARSDNSSGAITLMRDPTTVSIDDISKAVIRGRDPAKYPAFIGRVYAAISRNDRSEQATLSQLLKGAE